MTLPETSQTTRRRCVVLHDRTAEPHTMLLSSLAKRGLDVSVTNSVHRALAVLAVAQRERETCVLVLHEPGSICVIDRLVESVGRFAPRALVWGYDAQATPPLGPYFHEPKAAPAPEPPPRPATRSNQPPNLRLTGDAPATPSSADILDPDELDALLKPYDK